MAFEIQNNPHVILDVYQDAAGELRLRYQTTELHEYGDQILAINPPGVPTRFELRQPGGWRLTATHVNADGALITWEQSRSGVSYEFITPTSELVEVDVVATNTTNGATKVKKVYTGAKPKGALPDRP